MKFNKILSSALVLVMLLSSIIAVLPVNAMASESTAITINMGEVDAEINTPEKLLDLINAAAKYNYSTAQEMLEVEKKSGVLDVVSAGGYNLYINRYSGFMFYENTRTGQILTSNPVDPGSNSTTNLSTTVLSQLELEFKDVSDPSVETGGIYDSAGQIRDGFAISVTELPEQPDGRKGISVQYTMGVNAADFRVPRYITVNDFTNHLVVPMFKKIADAIEKYCPNITKDYDLSDNKELLIGERYNIGRINTMLDGLASEAQKILGKNNSNYSLINKYIQGTKTMFSGYSNLIVPANISDQDKVLFTDVPILNEGVSVYSLQNNNLSTYRLVNNAIYDVLGSEYTKDEANADLAVTGYVNKGDINSASFLVSINYTLNAKGELYYEVPMSAPYFVNNNPNYSIKSITPLKYFGAGDITKDGYIVYPDGSGTVVEFANIRTIQANYYSSVYGNDYGYATLTPSKAHLEQITMPVYGQVNEINANAKTKALTNEDTITNGFFAIVEEGSSLMNLNFSSSSSQHKYASTAASYQPHPMDMRDLSESLSAGVSGKYYIVSESKYEGNYKTKIVMLIDEKLSSLEQNSFEPSYIGMANCYRNYLMENGIISKLEESRTNKGLPLYIETLGAMDVTKKIMSFPVTVSTPLTSFEDVEIMYSAFSDAGIKNINFRLTGFANGGMSFTYPTKVKWQKSLGGKKGLNALLATADDYNDRANEGYNFGVYPDFDFLYIYNDKMFDGIGYRGNAAIMVDNRYASKQSFNAILQVYESLFAIVVSPDSFDALYEKFDKQYSKYDIENLSVATLGSEINSNFDTKNSINREDSLKYTKNILAKMSEDYSLMVDVGNVYAMRYVDHVLNAPNDSSHYKYSSYTIPFYGMVFHGFVNYAGAPLNYSGSADYDILRSIENGASLLYILCYENTNYLKADILLSKYYGVDYKNWKDIIVNQYNELNGAIGDLQNNIITDHKTLITERVVSRSVAVSNYATLINEYVENASAQFEKQISDVATSLRENGGFENKTNICTNVDEASVVASLLVAIKTSEAIAKADKLTEAECEVLGVKAEGKQFTLYDALVYRANSLADKFSADYPKAADESKNFEVALSADSVSYKTKYVFETFSYADDESYASTSYTCNNYNVVMVTYTEPVSGAQTIFFINYNTYDVKVKLDPSVYTGIKANMLDEKGYFVIEGMDYIKVN